MSETRSSINFTEGQEMYIYETFLETKSLSKTRQKFVKKFPLSSAPEENLINTIVKKIGVSGSPVSNKTKTKKNNQGNVQEYAISQVEDLKRGDQVARVNFCEWFFKSVNEGALDAQFIFYTGESWFHVSGYVNSHYTHSWLSQKPEIPLTQSKGDKIGVWCAISAKRIIGPIFYEETLNADEYKTLIIEPFLDDLTEEERSNAWFQQDSETVCADEDSKDKLRKIFCDRVISTDLWPARSPDLTPISFYLWQKLTYRVHEIKPRTVDDLKKMIQHDIENIELSELQRVHESVTKRYNLCISQRGETFQYLM